MILLLTAWLVAAQSDLGSWWAQLESARDMAAVSAVVRPPLDETGTQIADALVRLRRFELKGDRTEALVARRDMERLVSRRGRDNAWARFALGIVLARGPDVREVLGEDANAYVVWKFSTASVRAPRELKRALELDPSLHEAAYALARHALDLGDAQLLGDAMQALTRGGREADARALALRSEILLRLDEAAGAAELADSMESLGGDASLAAHLKAAALLREAGGAKAGAAAYLHGIDVLTERGAREYFDAVRALFSSRDVERWKTSDLEGKRRLLREYWTVDAALAGVPLHERLASHYQRLAETRRKGRVAPMGAGAAIEGGENDPRALGVASVSDISLLRHGDPERTERVLACGSDVLDIPLPLQPSVAECRASALGRYRALRNADAPRIAFWQARDRALAGTSYYPPFVAHLAMAWDIVQFRGQDGVTDVVAAVALPTESARWLADSTGLARPRVSVFLVDTIARQVQSTDTSFTFDTRRLPATGSVLLTASMRATPSPRVNYRVSVTDAANRAGRIAGDTITIRSYADDVLALSDVLITPLDGTPGFRRGETLLSIAPGRQFVREESFSLYYEVYGLAQGAEYRTDIAIEPVADGLGERIRSMFGDGRDVLRLSFTERVHVTHPVFGVQQTRTVDLSALLPGTYRMRITITAPDGATSSRDRMLFVGAPPL